MNNTIKPIAVIIPDDLLAEIEAVQANADLESFVCQAVRSYIGAIRQRKRHNKVNREYAGSEGQYHELSADLAEEVWLRLEQDALRSAGRCKQGGRFSEN